MLSTATAAAVAKSSAQTVIAARSASSVPRPRLEDNKSRQLEEIDEIEVLETSEYSASLSLAAHQEPLCLTTIPSEILYQIIDSVASSMQRDLNIRQRDVFSLISFALVHSRFYQPCRSAIARVVHLRNIESQDSTADNEPHTWFLLESNGKLNVSATAHAAGHGNTQRHSRQSMVIDTSTHPVSRIRVSGQRVPPSHERNLTRFITSIDLSLAVTAEELAGYLCQAFDTCPKLRHLRVHLRCADDYAIVSDYIRQHLIKTGSQPVSLRSVHFHASHACGNRHETASPCTMTDLHGPPWFTCHQLSLCARTINFEVVGSVLRHHKGPSVHLCAWESKPWFMAATTTVSIVSNPFPLDIPAPLLRSFRVSSYWSFHLLEKLAAPNLNDLVINNEYSTVMLVQAEMMSTWSTQFPSLTRLTLCSSIVSESSLKILMSIPQLKTLVLEADLCDQTGTSCTSSSFPRVLDECRLVSLKVPLGVVCFLSCRFAFPHLECLTVTDSPLPSRALNQYALKWSSFPSLISLRVCCERFSASQSNLSIPDLPEAGIRLRQLVAPITLLPILNPILAKLPAIDSLFLFSPSSLNASVVSDTVQHTATTSFTIACHPLEQGITVDSLQSLPPLLTLASLIIGKPNPEHEGTDPPMAPSKLLLSPATLDRFAATLGEMPRLKALRLENTMMQPTKRNVLVIPATGLRITFKVLASVRPSESLHRVVAVVPVMDPSDNRDCASIYKVRQIWADWCRDQGRREVEWSIVDSVMLAARGKRKGLGLCQSVKEAMVGAALTRMNIKEQHGGLAL
ncbi:hypothetical protein BCR44DRAFT_59526 [Catenaria anguillulae PL171]|uniref:F-box domain-containing protein n=1 Tax=Catenaria anguillulae PL171 TaxID=765915 RepID=A0A1Y2H750_9FUNG|nr:hypothetical protein BCR44DRAFT_59526 [Catenaria anguillulae PL171]